MRFRDVGKLDTFEAPSHDELNSKKGKAHAARLRRNRRARNETAMNKLERRFKRVAERQAKGIPVLPWEARRLGLPECATKEPRQKRARLSSVEAVAAAEDEGLSLTASNSKTGFKGACFDPVHVHVALLGSVEGLHTCAGVSFGGTSKQLPFQAAHGPKSLGYFATAEEAALAYARHKAQEATKAPPPSTAQRRVAEARRRRLMVDFDNSVAAV